MILERRAWIVARVTAALLVFISLGIIYWQMVRAGNLQPVAINLVQAASGYAPVQGDDLSQTNNTAEFLTGISTIEELQNLPQPVIQRTINFLRTIRRGTIYDRNGRVLAVDQPLPDGEITRFYSEPSLAHTIGYVSGLRTGVSGLELSYNTTLLGLDRPDSQIDQILNRPITGNDISMTVDSFVQRVAESELGDRSGAIVVLDAEDGAVLASVSTPGFDPNRVLQEAYVSQRLEDCELTTGCQAPFLNRTTQALYTPGSTWKTVVLIAALATGQVTEDTIFDFGEPVETEGGSYYVYQVDGTSIIDPNHAEDQLNLEMSYAKSANAAFARIGDEMPPDILLEYAYRFGFGAPSEIAYPLEIDYSPSQVAQNPQDLYSDNWLRAVTAIGQGELLSSPMNIGMLLLAIMNEGDLPVPFYVQSIKTPAGRVSNDLPNRIILENLMEPDTARRVRQMMMTVVEKGSGQQAQIPGIVVGGKTGTAQVGGDLLPHSWFAGFAEDGDRRVVVVVLVENAGEGSKIAAPIFSRVAEAALSHLGEPVREIVPTPGGEPKPTTIATAQEAETATPVSTSFPSPTPSATIQPEPTSQAATLAPTPTPVPTITDTSEPGGVLTPDIPRDPSKKDITAENPSCANMKDMPQATGEFIWPSPYQALSGGDFREGHPGLDLSAPSGSPVYAADTGLVIFAGWTGVGYGNTVLIDHGNGYQTLYAHLSQVSIYCGAKVAQGKLIGLSGSSGNSSGPHLHFEVRVPGGYISPLKVLPIP